MLEILISASALILVLLLLRFLLRGRISARLQYALWLLVLIRLLLPVTLFHSTVSVAAAAAPAVTRVETISEHTYVSSSPEDRTDAAAPVNTDPVVTGPALTLKQAVRIIWYAGMGAMAAWFFFVNGRLALRLRKSRVPFPGDHGLPVFVAEGIPSPCLFGLWRPAVYLTPRAAEDPDRARRILAHERTHFRHGDTVWALLRCVCLTVWWFHPLVWLSAALSRRDGELACDEGTIRALGEEERFDYGRTLVDMARVGVRPSDLLCGATAMTAGRKLLRERVERIANAPKTSAAVAALALLIAALAVGCTYAGAAPKQGLAGSDGTEVFRRYYSQRAAADTAHDYSRMDLDMLDAMSTGSSTVAVDTEELTIETAGAVVSGNTAEIILRVTAKQLDSVLRDNGGPGILNNYRFGEETAMLGSFTLNREYYYLSFNYIYPDTEETLASNQFLIHYWIVGQRSFGSESFQIPYWIEDPEIRERHPFIIPLTDFGYYENGMLVPLYQGVWDVEVPFRPAVETARAVPVGTEILPGDLQAALENVEITPLSCTVHLRIAGEEEFISDHWDEINNAFIGAFLETRENIALTFSDGSVWNSAQLFDMIGAGNGAEKGICLLFPCPIQTEEIAALSLFGQEMSLR